MSDAKERQHLIDIKDNEGKTAEEYRMSNEFQTMLINHKNLTQPLPNSNGNSLSFAVEESSDGSAGKLDSTTSMSSVLYYTTSTRRCSAESSVFHFNLGEISFTYKLIESDENGASSKLCQETASCTSRCEEEKSIEPLKESVISLLETSKSKKLMGAVADALTSFSSPPAGLKECKCKKFCLKYLTKIVCEIEKGASAEAFINIVDKAGKNFFHRLVKLSRRDLITRVLKVVSTGEKRFLLTSRTHSGQTSYHLASNDVQTFKLLLVHTPDDWFHILGSRDGNGNTAKSLANKSVGSFIKYIDEYYWLKSPPTSLVFYNKFEGRENERAGAEKEAQSLIDAFSAKGISSDVIRDFTADKLQECILSSDPKSALIVSIMSHGSEGDIEGVDRCHVSVERILDLMNICTPSLAPKVQCCDLTCFLSPSYFQKGNGRAIDMIYYTVVDLDTTVLSAAESKLAANKENK